MARKTDETIFDMLGEFGRELKLPKVDADAIIDHHRKNLEAVQKSVSAGASGAKTVLEKQRDLLQEQFHELTEAARSFRLPDNPKDAVSMQAELMRKAFETTVRNVSETAKIIQQSGAESIEILRKRIAESMEEIRGSGENKS